MGRVNYERALVALRDLGAEHGIQVVLLAHVWSGTHHHSPIPDGVVYVDTLEDFARYASGRTSDLAVSASDPHPSARGHAMIADSLFRQLQERGVWCALIDQRASEP